MNLLHDNAPLTLVILGWVVVIPWLVLSLLAVRRQFLPSSLAEHAWLAAVVGTAFLWVLHIRSPVGLNFGLLGGALFTLVFGRARAILGLLAALALHTLMTGGSWANFGINGTLLAVVPACTASLLQRLIERWLPRNIFVFIFGNGLFVTLLVTALASALLLAASAAGEHAVLRQLNEHLAYSLLLAWGEALVSGMIFSALVVFLPQSVLTYRQDTYLPPRRPSV
ncbi:MAG: energy-coupling factor ABC transporter permease [Burkholderiaceae bacterium]